MPRCHHCGGEIVFRTDGGGRPYPIHLSGGCFGWDSQTNEVSRDEPTCWQTRCPRCHAAVWFVRHNSGSVWLDGLGVPWPKHPCFDDGADRSSSALRRLIAALPDAFQATAVLGIVNRSRGSQVQVGEKGFHSTYLELTPLGGKPLVLRILAPLTVMRRELVCWAPDADGKTGWVTLPKGHVTKAEVVPRQVFELLPKQRQTTGSPRQLVPCPYCKAHVRESRLRRHLMICPAR